MIYLFYRMHEGKEFFYPVDLMRESDVIPNVEPNPGTIRVTDESGRIIWSLQ